MSDSDRLRLTVPMVDFMANLAVAAFTCGYCWERPGYPCRRSNGKDACRPHEERRQAAIRTLRDCGVTWPWDVAE